MPRQRKNDTPKEKVAILRRHLLYLTRVGVAHSRRSGSSG